MRLSTSQIYNNGLNGILDQQSLLARLQQQLSSGKRLLSPADDPLAASLAVNLAQTQSMNDAYSENRNKAMQSLGMEDNALQSMVETMQGLMQRVVEAGNGSFSDADRQSLVADLKGIQQQLLGLANSTDGNGQYLFSGYKGFTQPFTFNDLTGEVTYQGDAGQRTIQVDQSRQMAGGDVGTDIFNKAAAGTLAYVVKADPDNQGTGTFSSASIDSPRPTNNVGKDFSITFAENAVTGELEYTVETVPPDPAGPVTATYQAGEPIDMNGVSFTISGQPQAGDSFTVESPHSQNDYAAQPGANGGDASVGPISVSAPSSKNNVGKSFTIEFSTDGGGGLQYTVNVIPPDPTAPAPTPVPYEDGAIIDVGGVSFPISGTPQDGDTFAIDPHPNASNMDLFGTLNDLISALGQPVANDPVAQAKMLNQLATANKTFSLGLDNILTVKASVGSRMNELDALGATGTQKGLSYSKQLSGLEEIDLYEVISDLSLRNVALQAASSAFSMIQGSSLFSTRR